MDDFVFEPVRALDFPRDLVRINGMCEVGEDLYLIMTGPSRDRWQIAAIDSVSGSVVRRWENVDFVTFYSKVCATSRGSFWCLAHSSVIEYDVVSGRRLRAFEVGWKSIQTFNANDTHVCFVRQDSSDVCDPEFWAIDLRTGIVSNISSDAYTGLFPNRPDLTESSWFTKRIGKNSAVFTASSGDTIMASVQFHARLMLFRAYYRAYRFYWMLMVARVSGKK